MKLTPLDARSIEFRKEILKIIDASRRGHVGSAFSVVEIIRALYEDILRIDPQRPDWPERDRFILSKGHGCLALYVALAQKGFFPREHLQTFCEYDSILGGHPQYGKVPGVEASTGSLGHGLAIGVGIALSGQMDRKDFRTIVLLGDGECDEGTVWEAALLAAKHRLHRLIALVDYNKMQCYGTTFEVLDLEPFADKWRSFGFNVREVDGHDLAAVRKALHDLPFDQTRPQAIIFHTVKGRGVASLEKYPPSHHENKVSDEAMASFFKELEQSA